MTTFTEDFHAGAFILSEANGFRSREQRIVVSGQNLKAGHVVGTAHGSATATAFAGNAGSEGAMGTITVGAGAIAGTYKLIIIEPGSNAGVFNVEDPHGVSVGTGHVAAAFTGGGLSFTLADGGTDYSSGEGFNIVVAVGTGKLKEFNPANTDGSEVPTGILFDAVNASSTGTNADTACVTLERDCEVASNVLVWYSGADDGGKAAALAILAEHGIIGRSSVVPLT